MLDMARAREVVRGLRPTSRSGIEEEFADPRSRTRSRSRSASRSCATRPQPTTCCAHAVAGELISSEIEIRSGRRATTFADAIARQRDARAPAVPRSPPSAGSCSAPPAPTRGARGRSSRSSTPSTTAGSRDGSSYVAWRNNTFSLHVHVGVRGRRPRDRRLRPPAPGAARAARGVGQLAVPRRPRLGPALGAHARSSPRASRAAGSPRPFGHWAAYADYVEFLVRTQLDRRAHAALVERAPAPRLRHRRGADLRRPDERRGVDRARRR